MSRGAHSADRAAFLGCGLLAVLVFLLMAPPASAAEPRGSDASASIINGQSTTISKWPWQVAITVARSVAPRASTAGRFFCGGSVLAPRLVVTAGHCVSYLKKSQITKIEVVSGRTRLNSNQGEVARVSNLRMPVNLAGKRRYRSIQGAADWDVALLHLATPLSAEPIKLAGPDEEASWAPGQLAWTTGWGSTDGFADRVPARLQVTRQVIMSNALCRRADGVAFQPTRMVCMGGPGGNSSTCVGDSGGPLVVRTSDGYRLVGLTSYGDGACSGNIPSVDTRVAGDPIRRWVQRTAMNLAGVDVLGRGGAAVPAPDWCEVPRVYGLKPYRARLLLEASNCRLGTVRVDPWSVGRRGRISGQSRMWGWLAPPGFPIRVWVAP